MFRKRSITLYHSIHGDNALRINVVYALNVRCAFGTSPYLYLKLLVAAYKEFICGKHDGCRRQYSLDPSGVSEAMVVCLMSMALIR